MNYVLWLTSWFPTRIDLFNGDFVERHALATASYRKIIVLVINKDPRLKKGDEENHVEERENLVIYRIYYGAASKDNAISQLYSLAKFYKLQKKYYSQIWAKFGAPRLVHVHVAMKAGLLALRLNKRSGFKYLLSEHWTGYNPESPQNIYQTNFLNRALTKSIIKNAEMFLPDSASLGEIVNEHFVTRSFIHVPNVVDEHIFFLRKPAKKGVFTFNHTSFMVERKNPKGIIEACRILRATGVEFNMLMVGEAERSLILMAEEAGLNGYMHFTGPASYERVAELMQESDAFVLFSDEENFPCVVLEALCCGLPVVSSRVGGIPEILDETNGIIVPPRDSQALANAMKHMIKSYSDFDRERISNSAIARFNYKHVGRQINTLYEQVIAEK